MIHRAFERAMSLVLLALASGCVSRPTQVLLVLDSNAAEDSHPVLTLAVRRGALSLDALQSAEGSVVQLRSRERRIFPGSVSVVPAGGDRTATVSLLATVALEATASRPALQIERMHRFAFTEHTPKLSRIFFNIECATIVQGCQSVAADSCTLSRRCLELGQTCGDNATCVPVDLPTNTSLEDAAVSADALSPGDASESDADADGPLFVQQLFPPSVNSVTNRRPVLRWSGATSANASIELCRDRSLAVRCESVELVSEQSARPTSELAAGWWFWRVTLRRRDELTQSPVWQLRVGHRGADGDRSSAWIAEGDYNGDGVGDMVVGAPFAEGTGVVRVHYGSTSGLPAAASLVLRGSLEGERFGSSVAHAGDVNGDGFGDLIVGSPNANGGARSEAGVARLFLGSSTGLSLTAVVQLEGQAALDHFGIAVSGIGDTNGDGLSDVAIGADSAAPGGRMWAGTTSLFAGSSSGLGAAPVVVFEGRESGDRFGAVLSSAGDLNGDGFADLAVSAYVSASEGRTGAGTVRVFYGSMSGMSISNVALLGGTEAGENFGSAVSNAGDVNGDAIGDLIVGSFNASGAAGARAGRVRLFLGAPAGIVPSPAVVVDGTVAGGALGAALSDAGDCNGDGLDDVMIGAPYSSPNGLSAAGAVTLLLGDRVMNVVPSSVLNGVAVGENWGASLATLGDFDADGFADVVVGSGSASTSGRIWNGVVRLYRGSSAGLATTASAEFEGASAGERFGGAIARSRRPRRVFAHMSCLVNKR